MLTLNRRRRNQNWKIKDSERRWYDNQKEISKVFINDFSKIFTSKSLWINHELFDSFSPSITKEENRELIKEAMEEEIHETLLHINRLKAHGLDGF